MNKTPWQRHGNRGLNRCNGFPPGVDHDRSGDAQHFKCGPSVGYTELKTSSRRSISKRYDSKQLETLLLSIATIVHLAANNWHIVASQLSATGQKQVQPPSSASSQLAANVRHSRNSVVCQLGRACKHASYGTSRH
jgi:hypothetical protein